MDIFLGTLLLAFLACIHFGENAHNRPTTPFTRHFTYAPANKLVLVWDDAHGKPYFFDFFQGNREVFPSQLRTHIIDTYLEHQEDMFFLVTTMKLKRWPRTLTYASIKAATFYNYAGYLEAGAPAPFGYDMLFNREAAQWFNRQTRLPYRVAYIGQNIIPREAHMTLYGMTQEDHPYFEGKLRLFRLKNGYPIGIHYFTGEWRHPDEVQG